jgi:hypothetical protein
LYTQLSRVDHWHQADRLQRPAFDETADEGSCLWGSDSDECVLGSSAGRAKPTALGLKALALPLVRLDTDSGN